jgi:hypothetical protein
MARNVTAAMESPTARPPEKPRCERGAGTILCGDARSVPLHARAIGTTVASEHGMARVTILTKHALSREEAARRVREKLGSVAAARYRRQVTELREGWSEGTFFFGFEVVGMHVSGTLTVEETAIRVAADVPFAALLFKKKIEKEVRAELGSILD